MVDELLDDLAGLIAGAVSTGVVRAVQTADLDFAPGFVQILRSIQISKFTPSAGREKFPAGLAIRAAATDFFCAAHKTNLHFLMYSLYTLRKPSATGADSPQESSVSLARTRFPGEMNANCDAFPAKATNTVKIPPTKEGNLKNRGVQK